MLDTRWLHDVQQPPVGRHVIHEQMMVCSHF